MTIAATEPPRAFRSRRHTPLTPMRQQAAQSMRRLAKQVQDTHPDMTVHQHLRDAARVLESGNEEGAQRHLRAAIYSLSPQSLMRNGQHTDDAHIAARAAMHGVHRHLLLVKDIADVNAKNQAAIRRDSYGDDATSAPPEKPLDPNAGYGPGALAAKPTARQPGGDRALNAPDRTNSGGSDPTVADPVGPQPKGSKQFAYGWDHLAAVIELTGDAQHRHIPGSPYIYEHGYIPLTPEAAQSHFKGKVPKGWKPPRGVSPGGRRAGLAVLKKSRVAAQARAAAAPAKPAKPTGATRSEKQLGLISERMSSGDKTSGEMQAGDMQKGHQAIAQAPVGILGNEKSRSINGRNVKGSWSDPWWMAGPDGKTAVSQRWKSPAQTAFDYKGSKIQRVHVPAMDQRVLTPWTPQMQKQAEAEAVKLMDTPSYRRRGVNPTAFQQALVRTAAARTAAGLAYSWNELAGVIDLSAKTAMLEVTPAPYGKPGGPGLYDVKGMKHSDYFEQIVKALIEKRGMDKGRASKIAWGALKKWAAGTGHVHPEVRAAAAGALAEEKAKGAAAKAVHGHAVSWDDVARVIELVGPEGFVHGWHFVGVPGSADHSSFLRSYAGKLDSDHPGTGAGDSLRKAADAIDSKDFAAAHQHVSDAYDKVRADPAMRGKGSLTPEGKTQAANLAELDRHYRMTQGLAAQNHAVSWEDVARVLELVGPKGYEHGWVKVGTGKTAGILTGPHPADKMTVATDKRAAAKGLSTADLKAADAELSRRAAALGKPGQLSKGHKAVRAELAARKVGGKRAPRAAALARSWDDLAAVIDLAYNPQQQRVPPGQPGAGRFGAGGGQATAPPAAQQAAKPAQQPVQQQPAQQQQSGAKSIASQTASKNVKAMIAKNQQQKQALLNQAQGYANQINQLEAQRKTLQQELASASGQTNSGQSGSTTSSGASTTSSGASTTSSGSSTTASSAPSTSSGSSSSSSPSTSGTSSTTPSNSTTPSGASTTSSGASTTSSGASTTSSGASTTGSSVPNPATSTQTLGQITAQIAQINTQIAHFQTLYAQTMAQAAKF